MQKSRHQSSSYATKAYNAKLRGWAGVAHRNPLFVQNIDTKNRFQKIACPPSPTLAAG
jgi:hypothetical protein